MANLNLQKVNLSSIKAIAHDGVTLQILVERNGGYCLQSLPASLQAFQGLLQLAQFASLLQQSDNGLTARTQFLDKIRMVPVNSSNVATYWLASPKLRKNSKIATSSVRRAEFLDYTLLILILVDF